MSKKKKNKKQKKNYSPTQITPQSLGLTETLNKLDPAENYKGTEFEGLDPFQRQLKRFNIRPTYKEDSHMSKFFKGTPEMITPDFCSNPRPPINYAPDEDKLEPTSLIRLLKALLDKTVRDVGASVVIEAGLGRNLYLGLIRELTGFTESDIQVRGLNIPLSLNLYGFSVHYIRWMDNDNVAIGNHLTSKRREDWIVFVRAVYDSETKTLSYEDKKSESDESEIKNDTKPEGRLYPDVQYEAPTRINAVFPRGTSQTNMERLIEEKVVAECIKVNVDPDILKNQTAELQRQKTILDDFAMMVKDGRMLRRPCGVGAQVWLVEKGKMHEGRVVSYTQLLKPNSDREELKFADIEVFGLNTIVRRYCHEFEKTVFTQYDHAQEALKKQLAEKGENV